MVRSLEEDAERTEARQIKLHIVDRKEVWFHIDDVEWAVRNLYVQIFLNGVPLVPDGSTGPGNAVGRSAVAERRDDILDRPFRELGTHRDVAESAVVEDLGPDRRLSSKCTARARKRVHHPCVVNLRQSFSSSFDQFCVFVIPSSFAVFLLCSSQAPRWLSLIHI